MTPTWEGLAPIVRGAHVSADGAWRVIETHAGFIRGHVARALRAGDDVTGRLGGLTGAVEDAFAFVITHLHDRITKPPPGLPVAPRPDGSPGSPAKWFGTVVANLARDWLRSERRRFAREIASEAVALAPPPAAEDTWTDEARRKRDRLLQHADRAGVPATHVLAWLCLACPEHLHPDHVARAHAYTPTSGSRSGTPGLARDPDTTWSLLEDWRARHPDPQTSAARTGLAWVLRSDDPGPPDTWRARCPHDSKRSAETVGKWAIRCADALSLPRS